MTSPVRLSARTVPLNRSEQAHLPTDLIAAVPTDVPAESVVSWIREGDGVVGWGHAASVRSTGHGRFEEAERWWQEVAAAATVDDPIAVPGSGLITFGSFAFSPESDRGGALTVPEVVLGRHGDQAWLTTIEPVDRERVDPRDVLNEILTSAESPAAPIGAPNGSVTWQDGSVPASEWPSTIALAIDRIADGEVEKVVLARDVEVTAADGWNLTGILHRLTQRYRATWTFAVDGLVGATPEMLVRLQDGTVRSRVLAGTVPRGPGPAPVTTEPHADLESRHHADARVRLISSLKDLEEHDFAVRSVADALSPHCSSLDVPEQPFVLELPDVYHLATDITGTLTDGATSLRLAAALHPSAAVCGTPSDVAARIIADLEKMDRGRYAGPVGWMDASGEGDWGIALRCGQLNQSENSMRLFAGGGIVAASNPQAELAETEIKLEAMKYALGC